MASAIFTNNALIKMKQWGLSESQVLDAFNNGTEENSLLKDSKQAVKKYPGYEIGVIYSQDKLDGKYQIISAWKRGRR